MDTNLNIEHIFYKKYGSDQLQEWYWVANFAKLVNWEGRFFDISYKSYVLNFPPKKIIHPRAEYVDFVILQRLFLFVSLMHFAIIF